MNAKHDEKIRETQIANGAQGYIDQFIWPCAGSAQAASGEAWEMPDESQQPQMTQSKPLAEWEMSPEERIVFRAFIAELIRKPATSFPPIRIDSNHRFAVRRYGMQMEDAYDDAHPTPDDKRPSFSEVSGLEMLQLNDWSDGQFLELCTKWPKGAYLLLMDQLDALTKLRRELGAREPSFRAVARPNRDFVVETRRRRIGIAA